MGDDAEEWLIEHVSSQNYEVISMLDYDATDVLMEGTNVAFVRIQFDPQPQGWLKKFPAFEAGAHTAVNLSPEQTAEPSRFGLTIKWTDAQGGLHTGWYRIPMPGRLRRDIHSPVPPGFAAKMGGPATRRSETRPGVGSRPYPGEVTAPNPKDVFVVHGRNEAARSSMFTFLRAIGLNPIEWNKALAATGSASPYIGQVLDTAFDMAQAIVVLMTPDEMAGLLPDYANGPSDPETTPGPQARPNVLFEAGMAMGRDPKRTVLVELGTLRPFSDVAGRHAVRLNSSPEKRLDLANRLRTAGCEVDSSGTDWLNAGDFTPPKAPSGPPATGRRLPSNTKKRLKRLDGRYLHRGSGSDRVQITNVGSEDVFELTSPNTDKFHGHLGDVEIPRLPVGKSFTLIAHQASGAPDTWDLIVNGRTDDGADFSESLYLDLNG